MIMMFGVMQFGIGLLFLWDGFKKEGLLFEDPDIPAQNKAKYFKLVRVTCFILGPVLVFCGVFTNLNAIENSIKFKIASCVWAAAVCYMIAILVIRRRMANPGGREKHRSKRISDGDQTVKTKTEKR